MGDRIGDVYVVELIYFSDQFENNVQIDMVNGGSFEYGGYELENIGQDVF